MDEHTAGRVGRLTRATYEDPKHYTFTGVLSLADGTSHQMIGRARGGEAVYFTPPEEATVTPQIPAPLPTRYLAYVPSLSLSICGIVWSNDFSGIARVAEELPTDWYEGCTGTFGFHLVRIGGEE